MKTYLYVALTIIFAAVVAGCGQDNIKQALGNLDRDCVRHYAGSLASGVPAQGTVTFEINCKPSGVSSAPVNP